MFFVLFYELQYANDFFQNIQFKGKVDRYSSNSFITSVVDTDDKLIAGVVVTGDKLIANVMDRC